MKNLKVWQRFVLMATATILPFALVTYKMVASIESMGVQFAKHESQGLRLLPPTARAAQEPAAASRDGSAYSERRRLLQEPSRREADRPRERRQSRCRGRPASGRDAAHDPEVDGAARFRRAFFSTAVFAEPLPRALPSTPR